MTYAVQPEFILDHHLKAKAKWKVYPPRKVLLKKSVKFNLPHLHLTQSIFGSIRDSCVYTILLLWSNPILQHPFRHPNPLWVGGIPMSLFADLQFFAGNTVDWLIRVARFILDPRGTGALYTFQTKTVDYWLGVEKDDSWRTVQAGEVLEATVYEYQQLNNQPMVPTTNASQNQAAIFCRALLQRHSSACVVSGIPRPRRLKASHLIPRRMGDNGVQSAFQLFTGLDTPVTRFHPSVGILLFSGLDDLVDVYEVVFWGIGTVSLLS